MTLFVRHPVRNIGKINSYERQVGKYKGGKSSEKNVTEKKIKKANKKQP
jgi:hypothetical protein